MSRSAFIFIAIITTISIPLTILDYAHFPYSDGPEHGAAVRALAKNWLHPGDPMLNTGSGSSPRYVPSILIMALFMKISGLDVLVVLKLFEIVGIVFFLISVAFFSREYFNDAGQAAWSMSFLLFFWGLGWTGANAYMFSAILYTAYYPSVVSFSLAFLALYFQIRFLRDERPGFLIGTLIVGALCFVNHPLTGGFFFINSAVLYLEREGLNKKALSCYALSIVVTLCLTGLWPYYNFLASFIPVASGEMQKSFDYIATHQYLYSKVLLRSGAALAGIPVVFFYGVQRRYLLLWCGGLLFGLLYVCGFFHTISLTERCIFFMLCLLQIAVSRICRECSATNVWTKHRAKKIVFGIIVMLLAGGIVTQATLTGKEFLYPCFTVSERSMLPQYVNPNALHDELKEYLKEGDVVLSDIYSSWSIPVYTGAKIVALFHTPPHVSDNFKRVTDVEAFFTSSLSDPARQKILQKYGVTHIFLNFKIAGKDIEPILLEKGYPVVVRTDSFCIFSTPK